MKIPNVKTAPWYYYRHDQTNEVWRQKKPIDLDKVSTPWYNILQIHKDTYNKERKWANLSRKQTTFKSKY